MRREDEDPKAEPKEVAKPTAKAYYHVNSKLAIAPHVVHEEVAKINSMPYRSRKQGKLQQMVVAFAKSGWNHKLLKSIEKFQMHRARQ